MRQRGEEERERKRKRSEERRNQQSMVGESVREKGG